MCTYLQIMHVYMKCSEGMEYVLANLLDRTSQGGDYPYVWRYFFSVSL